MPEQGRPSELRDPIRRTLSFEREQWEGLLVAESVRLGLRSRAEALRHILDEWAYDHYPYPYPWSESADE